MKLRLISIIAVILAGIVAAGIVFAGYISDTKEYEQYIAAARTNAEKEIPYIACQNYESAFGIRCNDEAVYEEYLKQASILGGDIYSSAVKKYVEYFPTSGEAYERLCEMQYNNGSYKKVIETALKARELGAATDQIGKWYTECSYMLKNVKTGFEEAQSFLGSYARVKVNGVYGYVNQSGKYLLAPQYKEAGMMLGASAAVYENDEWHMINSGGYTVARTNVPVDYLGTLSNGKICISKDGKYGYTTAAMVIPDSLPYDYATTFRNGVAAVKVGEKWAFINAEEKNLTDFIFDEVLLDEFNTCLNGGVVFAKKDGKYYMFDENGKQISKQGFDNAYPFVGSEPAAICVEGKWGFVGTDGKIVIEPQFEEAKSFNLNLGAVCKDGLWGYINKSGELRIEHQFEDCMPFAANGIAAVKDARLWKYVQLLGYYN